MATEVIIGATYTKDGESRKVLNTNSLCRVCYSHPTLGAFWINVDLWDRFATGAIVIPPEAEIPT